MKVLVTGAAGFIGSATCAHLLARGHQLTGVDCFTSYYSPQFKRERFHALLGANPFELVEADLCRPGVLESVVGRVRPEKIIHLAAEPGLRGSLEHPHRYLECNVSGFLQVVEACRRFDVAHLIFASSSSVYGANDTVPSREEENTDRPLSLYAATKKANELMAHAYAHCFGLPSTALRFFTVYGPWGRPDMVPYKFCLRAKRNEPIELYHGGEHFRDFTYVDEVSETIGLVVEAPPPRGPLAFRTYNVGNQKPERIDRVVELLGQYGGIPLSTIPLPPQKGDAAVTFADTTRLREDFGFAPSLTLEEGLKRFVAWFQGYHSMV